MIKLRPAAARGFADHGWLVARHSFPLLIIMIPLKWAGACCA